MSRIGCISYQGASLVVLLVLYSMGFLYKGVQHEEEMTIRSPHYHMNEQIKGTNWFALKNESMVDDVCIRWSFVKGKTPTEIIEQTELLSVLDESMNVTEKDVVVKISKIEFGQSHSGLTWKYDSKSTTNYIWLVRALIVLLFSAVLAFLTCRQFYIAIRNHCEEELPRSFLCCIGSIRALVAIPPKCVVGFSIVVGLGHFVFTVAGLYFLTSLPLGPIFSFNTCVSMAAGVIPYTGSFILDSFLTRYYTHDERAYSRGKLAVDQYQSHTPFIFRSLLVFTSVAVPVLIINWREQTVIGTSLTVVLLAISYYISFIASSPKYYSETNYIFQRQAEGKVYGGYRNSPTEYRWHHSWIICSLVFSFLFFFIISSYKEVIPLLSIARWDHLTLDFSFCVGLLMATGTVAIAAMFVTLHQFWRRLCVFNFDWWVGSLLSCSVPSLIISWYFIHSNSVVEVSLEMKIIPAVIFVFISMVSFCGTALFCDRLTSICKCCD